MSEQAFSVESVVESTLKRNSEHQVNHCIYQPYSPTLSAAQALPEHPNPVVESATLAAIRVPEVTHKLHASLLTGQLSSLQAEAVLLACECHKILKCGIRGGMLIGDGAGVGKGRTIAGIVQENFLRKREKALWISKSHNLFEDARRDFLAIGVSSKKRLQLFSKIYKPNKDLPSESFCLFIPYSAFRQNLKAKMKAILGWLTTNFTGVIILDECHVVKNEFSKCAEAIRLLDESYPKARFVYSSATVAESASELAYMSRLFLWGAETSCPEGFHQLQRVVDQIGIIGMESIAMELKHRGAYVARRLNFEDASFNVQKVLLSKKESDLYNSCVEIWSDIKHHLNSMHNSRKNKFMRYYWAQHQQFFRLLCVSLKMDYLICNIRYQLKKGYTVVVGLQSTGNWLNSKNREATRTTLPSSLTEKLLNVVNHFDTLTTNFKLQFRQRISKLSLPPNALDYLISKIGPKNISELTGRTGFYEKVGSSYVWKRLSSPRSNRMNDFMEGRTNVAIISEACSTGISLHADRSVANQKRRVHITLELPWSAEQVIQQCGRTLRSNQTSSPIYRLLVLDLAGETRFGYGVAQKMSALGAITQADRNFAMNGLNEFNFNSRYTLDAIVATLRSIVGEILPIMRYPDEDIYDFFEQACLALIDVGVLALKDTPILLPTITANQFFNRLLGIKTSLQNKIMRYVMDVYNLLVSQQKALGLYEEGVVDLGKGESYINSYEEFYIRNSAVRIYAVMADVGISFTQVQKICKEAPDSEFYSMKNNGTNSISIYLAVPEPNSDLYAFVMPYGNSLKKTNRKQMDGYTCVTESFAESVWIREYESKQCIHLRRGQPCSANGRYCETGNRFQKKFLLTGMMWSNLVSICECLALAGIPALQLARFWDSEERLIGVIIDTNKVDSVRQTIVSKFTENMDCL